MEGVVQKKGVMLIMSLGGFQRVYGNTRQRQAEEEANSNKSLIMQVSDGATRKPDNYSS